MAKQIAFANDDYELDDAVLWAAIDSAAASFSSRTTTTPTSKPRAQPFTPIPFPLNSPSNNTRTCRDNNYNPDGEVLQNDRPNKIAKTSGSSFSSPSGQMVVVKNGGRTPFVSPVFVTETSETKRCCSVGCYCDAKAIETENRHSLAGQFPTVSLFKEYQNAAMAILEKSDYTMISGHSYIKKTGWRKISFYFNLSYEIKDKIIEFDDNRNVQRAEFTVRAYMQGGRFSDGWGSCDRREKKFMKPNHDIPSTAETRAKNKACQDLLGIGEYRASAFHT